MEINFGAEGRFSLISGDHQNQRGFELVTFHSGSERRTNLAAAAVPLPSENANESAQTLCIIIHTRFGS